MVDIETTCQTDILVKILDEYPIPSCNLRAYNSWLTDRLPEQISSRFIEHEDMIVTFGPTTIIPPYKTEGGATTPLLPSECRHKKLDYMCEIRTMVTLRRNSDPRDPCSGAIIDQSMQPVSLGFIPCMVGCMICHTYGKNPGEKIAMGEDPRDFGGYVIIGGHEKFSPLGEKLRNDCYHIDQNPKDLEQKVTINRDSVNGLIPTSIYMVHHLNKETKMKENVVELGFSGLKISNAAPSSKKRSIFTLNVFCAIRLYLVMNKGTLYQEIGEEETENFITKIIDPQNILNDVLKFVLPEKRNRVINALINTVYNCIVRSDTGSTYWELDWNVMIEAIADNDKNERESKLKKERLKTPAERVFSILSNSLFCHSDISSMMNKYHNLCIMIAIMGEHIAGYRPLTDKDLWRNKRLDTLAKHSERVFRTHWKGAIEKINKALTQSTKITIITITSSINGNDMTKYFQQSFSGTIFNPKGASKNKKNPINMIPDSNMDKKNSMITRITSGIDPNSKSLKTRQVQPDQLGIVDPSGTADSGYVGIIKDKTLASQVSINADTFPVISILDGSIAIYLPGSNEPVVKNYISGKYEAPYTNPLLINGRFVGWCNGNEARLVIVEARRQGLVERMTAVEFDKFGYVEIFTDEGRALFPLFIVRNNQLVIDTKDLWRAPLETLFSEGCIEFIDVRETTHVYIASNKDKLDLWAVQYKEAAELINEITTQLETIKEEIDQLEDEELLSNLRQALRENIEHKYVYQQELSEAQNISSEEASNKLAAIHNLIDNEVAQILNSLITYQDQRNALILTRTKDLNQQKTQAQQELEFLNNNRYTHMFISEQGISCPTLSQMPFMEKTQAPRITYFKGMLNQALNTPNADIRNRYRDETKIMPYASQPLVTNQLQKFFMSDIFGTAPTLKIYFLTLAGMTQEDAFILNRNVVDSGIMNINLYTVIQYTLKSNEVLKRPTEGNEDRYRFLTNDGLPMINAPLDQGDYVIGKVTTDNKGAVKDTSIMLKAKQSGIVESVNVTMSGNEMMVMVRLLLYRSPRIGDKMSSYYAQKGTISVIMDPEDMPFDEKTGETPDIIVNPTSFKRMTAGYWLEPMISIYTLLTGRRYDATMFKKHDFDEIYRVLTEAGYHSRGYRKMVDPRTGQTLNSMVFGGYISEMVLEHLGDRKFQIQGVGVKDINTRQPIHGGILGCRRVGNMELFVLGAHGASKTLQEIVTSSDKYEAAICKRCGGFAEIDVKTKIISCPLCKEKLEPARTSMPWVFNLTHFYQAGVGVWFSPKFEEFEENKELFFVKPVELDQEEELETELEAEEINEEYLKIFRGEEEEEEEFHYENLSDEDYEEESEEEY